MPLCKGNTKIKSIYKGSTKIVKIYKGSNSIYTGLPSTYQEVEYIESTGTQYIDTGVVANQNITFALSYYVQNGSHAKIFGSRKSATDSALAIYYNNSGWFTLNYGANYIEQQNAFTEMKVNIKSSIDNSKYKIFVNGQLKLDYELYSSFYNGNMLLCSYNNNGTPALSNQTEQLKIYYCKIYDNGVLIRDFVPCYRKSDNEIGLYDLVNGVFYTNQGTGTFLKGNDV